MRIITLNANGIRSAELKGFYDWLRGTGADVVCMQETKCQEHQRSGELLQPAGYYACYHDAEKKGYSGVGIYSRIEPTRVIAGMGFEDVDREGRYLRADFGALSVISLYVPSGSSGEERQEVKYSFLDRLASLLAELRADGRDYILCGDWNIAHTKLDIKNWRGNQKNSGFLPQEREWMDRLFGELGFVDAFRVVNEEADQYTWWSNRGQAWAKNIGWRIDYQVITPGLRARVQTASIYKDQRFSDHAPLIIDYDGELMP
ncbi:MAG: exodeoxyribonuclease III [Chromatiales bacterium]|jgi:exodeoxyribonuclease-3|nr:exodeoxyribonuclease III [Chromatiales bacterium]